MNSVPATTSTDALALARRHLLERGEVADGLIPPWLARSWQRSREAGLSPLDGPWALPLATEPELRFALGRHRPLLTQAEPMLALLDSQVRGTGCLVLLANGDGLVLDVRGEAAMMDRAATVSLRPGGWWHEHHRGTNAIGAALAERCPVAVCGAEHYLEPLGFLGAAAAPLAGADGMVHGAVAVACDHRALHPHTLSLVDTVASQLQDQLFHARHPHGPLVRLHPTAEGIGHLGEGLLALSDDGWIMGANPTAQRWLQLEAAHIGSSTLERLLGPHARRLQTQPPSAPARRVVTVHGQVLYARDEPERRRRVWAWATPAVGHEFSAAAGTPPGQDMLPGFGPAEPLTRPARDDGREDPRVRLAFTRALKVHAQGVPLIVHGEAGTGKKVFARAVHAAGGRGHQKVLTIPCAGLTAQALAALLTPGGTPVLRQPDIGTVLIDHLDLLPPALQPRLLAALWEEEAPGSGAAPALVVTSRHSLQDLLSARRLREDLHWALHGLDVHLPPLRERGDIVRLMDDILAAVAQTMGRPRPAKLAEEVREALLQHPWPGNLRQLHAVLRTACALLGPHEEELGWEHISEDIWDAVFSRAYREEPDTPPAPLHAQAGAPSGTARSAGGPATAPASAQPAADTNLRRLSDQLIQQTIKACGGNMSDAARRLGISRNTLYRRLKSMP